MGLMHNLNPTSSGGVEVHRSTGVNDSSSSARTLEDVEAEPPMPARALPKGFGRIIRDESGNVIDVELPEDEDEAGGTVAEAPVAVDNGEWQGVAEMSGWVTALRGTGAKGGESEVVQREWAVRTLLRWRAFHGREIGGQADAACRAASRSLQFADATPTHRAGAYGRGKAGAAHVRWRARLLEAAGGEAWERRRCDGSRHEVERPAEHCRPVAEGLEESQASGVLMTSIWGKRDLTYIILHAAGWQLVASNRDLIIIVCSHNAVVM